MALFRTVLFWMHLVAGVVAGAVILLMSVTGVALTYEKQVVEWADRHAYRWPPPSPGTRPLPPETLLAAVATVRPEAVPTGMTRRADPSAPATVVFQGGASALVQPYTGAVLGDPPPGLRAFFRTMTSWHRWLALEGASRSTGRLITGLANAAFLFIVLSGIYLWLPRVWTRMHVAQVLWFRRQLPPKARDFNWHNVVGIWSALPLAVVVAGAIPISFPWASNLVYRVVGDTPPQARAAGAAAPGGEHAVAPPVAGLDQAWAAAEARVPGWRTMTARLPGAAEAPLTIVVDEGYGGQPQKRHTLTATTTTGAVVGWEAFDDLGPGRRARSWLRFAHTGEYYGLAGQTVAGVVSAGGALLVYTGLALAWRRWRAWLRQRAPSASGAPVRARSADPRVPEGYRPRSPAAILTDDGR